MGAVSQGVGYVLSDGVGMNLLPSTFLAIALLAAPLAVLAGDGARQITSDASRNDRPAWSPDGSQLAFDSDRSGNKDIWVTSANGGPATRITTEPEDEFDAAWSPDGSAKFRFLAQCSRALFHCASMGRWRQLR